MKIIAVTDRRQSIRPFLEQIELISKSGADMIVLREKDLSRSEYSVLAEKVLEICKRNGCGFCINFFSEIVSEVEPDYVWQPFRKFINEGRPSKGKLIVSVHSGEEASEAVEKGADILVYGNVFETTCKPGKDAMGTKELVSICSNANVPVYAIGGITLENMEQLKGTEVSGICLMSGFMRCEDPAAMVSAARSIL